jgi:BirA family transcriptional regulator, biotin operon repressor / biotin---[acetyl-CoA-carboxylase] ligase
MAVPIPSRLGPPALLVRLADGAPHSGQQLAAELRLSPAALAKAITQLRAQGVELRAWRGGYRLPQPVELLDAGRIRALLTTEHKRQLRDLQLLFEVDSTNTCLLQAPAPPVGHADACLSELQHAGRGRLGRPWIAPFGAGLALSLGWVFKQPRRSLPALSLAVGVAVTRALARAGAQGMMLKWPNDIWFQDRKIGGVLSELRAEPDGAAYVVIGVGLNVSLSKQARRKIESTQVRVASAADACPTPPSRNGLAGAILDELLSMLAQFGREGFAPFHPAWMALDALGGRAAQVMVGESAVSGIACGIDPEGALLMNCGGRLKKFVSGEARLRLIEEDS